jgi:uncharacterized protein
VAAAPPTSGPRSSTRDVILVGLGAGFLSGVFGVGGGLLVVPALVLVLHFDQRLANGTSLAAILPISAASLVTYWSQGNVDWPAALYISIGALVGAVLGTRLMRILPVRTITVAFVILMLATAVRLFISTEAAGRAALDVVDATELVLLGLASGTLAGLLGVGGGVIMVPAMVVLFGIEPVVAKGTSVAVIIPTSLMGTWRNRKHRFADMRVAAILGTSGILSAVAGGLISDRMSADLSNVLFALLLIAVSARQLWTLRRTTEPTVVASVTGDGDGALENR